MDTHIDVSAFTEPSEGEPWICVELFVESSAGEFEHAYYLSEDKALELQRKLARALDQLAAARARAAP